MSPVDQLKQQKQSIIRRHVNLENIKGLVQTLTTLVPIALLWCVVGFGSSVSYWLVLSAAMLLALFSLRVLVLMHECGHGSLYRTSILNRVFGFLFGVLSGMPQFVWSQHHDFHHANNGNWEKYRGPLTTPSVVEYAAMTVGKQRLYRYTRSIAMAPLGGFVYLLFNPRYTWLKGTIAFLVHLVKSKLGQPMVPISAHAASFKSRYWSSRKEYWHMFWNNVVLLSVWALMCWAIGAALFFSVYVVSVSLAGGAGIALFTVQHNFEHAYATDSKRWDYDAGALEGTSFLVLPGWLNWFTVNIAYHHIHHLSAKIPNYCLVKCHNENEHLFSDVRRVRLSGIHKALQCILWDTSAQRIISVSEYQRQVS